MEYQQRIATLPTGRGTQLLILLLLGLFSFSAGAFGSSGIPEISISTDKGSYVLGRYMLFLEDQNGDLRIEDVSSPDYRDRFNLHDKDFPNFGFTRSAYWFGTRISNPTGQTQTLILEQTSSWIDSIKLYTPSTTTEGGWDELHVGDKLPFSARPIRHQDFLLPIEIGAGETKQIYLRIASRSLLLTPLTLWNTNEYQQHSLRFSYLYGLLFGVLLIMFFYNLFLYFSIREPAYLYYILFVASVGLMAFTSNGFTYMLLTPESNWTFERLQLVGISMTQISAILFTFAFLNTRQILPSIHRLLTILIAGHCFLLLSLPIANELDFFAKVAVTSASVYAPLLLLTGVLAISRGAASAKYFLLGWSFSVIGILITALTLLGVLGYNLYSYNAAFIGVVLDVGLLSFALADRINVMRREKEGAQHQLTEALQESKEELENKVRERTAEIAYAKDYADRANAAKSRFLSNTSHELRTPLNAIIGFSQLLCANVDQTLSAKHKQYAEYINSSGNHLLKLIDDVLDLSKIESGRYEFSMEPVSFRAIVDEAVGLLSDQSERSAISLIDHTENRSDPFFVIADKTRLTQVVINLLSNAIKYNRQGGSVTICLAQDGSYVSLEVNDTGLGIPEDRLIELFEPFSRLDAESSGIAGSGIGLVIAKQLTELMQGEIEVDSRVDEGTRFTVRFPSTSRDLSVNTASENQTMRPDNELRGKILIIEDNPINLLLIEEALSSHTALEFITASTGREGVAMALETNPDLILTDIGLPDIDGFEVFRQIHDRSETKHIPIIAISASALTENIKKAEAAGFEAYLTKPVQIDAVLEVMRKYVPDRSHPSD